MPKVESEKLIKTKSKPGAHGEFPVTCKCPLCEKPHIMNRHWVGKIPAPIYCKPCAGKIGNIGSGYVGSSRSKQGSMRGAE